MGLIEHKNFRCFGLILTAVMLSLGFGCVKKPKSKVQTLDNLEDEDPFAHPNACVGVTGKNQTDYYKGTNEFVKQALLAVPATVQENFFVSMHGAIELTPDPLAKCREKLPKEVGDSLHANTKGCWVYDCKGDNALIVVGDSQEAILHDLVREFGYVYANFSLRRKFVGKTVAISGEEPNDIDYYLDSLAVAFLVDVLKHQGNLSSITNRLPLALPENQIPSEAELRKAYLALSPPIRRVWSSKVTAEAFDNVFCSDATRKKLDDYKNVKALALALFADMDAQSLFPKEAESKPGIPGAASFSTFNGFYREQLAERSKQGQDNGLQSMRDFAASLNLCAAPKLSGASLTETSPLQAFMLVRLLTTLFGGLLRGGGVGGVNVATAPGFGGMGPVYPYPTPYPIPYPTMVPGTIPPVNGTVVPMPTSGTLTTGGGDLAEMTRQVVDATNQWRAIKRQVEPTTSPLQLDAELSTECQLHAKQMLDEDSMKHFPLNKPIQGAWAENIHNSVPNGYAAVFGPGMKIEDCYVQGSGDDRKGWCNHSPHYQNLENPAYHYIGVGYATDGNRRFWCQIFR